MTDLVKQGETLCSCGEKLTGFTVGIGWIYEAEFPDQVDLLAADIRDAFQFCDGGSPVHDVITWHKLFSIITGKEIETSKYEGLHENVPTDEAQQEPRHPFFFREKA